MALICLFAHKRILNRHTFPGEKLIKCDVCQKSLSQKLILKTHMVIHTDLKAYKSNFKCAYAQRCTYASVQLRSLHSH